MDSTEHRTACITGATSGLGAAFATRLAAQGYNLILTGRRKEKIEALSQTLASQYNIQVDVILAELSNDTELDMLAEKIRGVETLAFLINNAGFAKMNAFHEEDFSTHETMLKVHNFALIKLCHAVLPKMVAAGKGTIINVSSISGFMPYPTLAMYSAVKSFVKLFTESLYLELRGTGVRVQALCPGITRTDFHKKMGFDDKTFYKDKGMIKAMTPEEVIDVSLHCLEKDSVVCVPGSHNAFMSGLMKIMPRGLMYKMVSAMAQK